MASPCKPQDTQRRTPRLAGKGGQGTGRTAYGIRGYIRGMKRTKCRMQADKGKQGRNTRAMNHTHTLDTAVRKGRGDRVCGGNLQGFRNTRSRRTQTPGMQRETESWEGTSRDSDPHARRAVQVQKDGATAGLGKDNTVKRSEEGGRWTGLMKRSRACVVNPSLGVHFSPTSHGEDGCFVPPQVACARTE